MMDLLKVQQEVIKHLPDVSSILLKETRFEVAMIELILSSLKMEAEELIEFINSIFRYTELRVKKDEKETHIQHMKQLEPNLDEVYELVFQMLKNEVSPFLSRLGLKI
jgi:hypothetical protein